MRLARSVRTSRRPRAKHEKAGSMHRFGSQGSLRIAIIAPPWFSVPPKGYGGVENVCADLVGGLVARGHTVTLVGAGTDGTAGQFLATYSEPPSARLGEPLPEALHAGAAWRMLARPDVGRAPHHSPALPLLARRPP